MMYLVSTVICENSLLDSHLVLHFDMVLVTQFVQQMI